MNVRYAKYAPTNYTNQSIAKEFSICDAVDRVVASDTDLQFLIENFLLIKCTKNFKRPEMAH